MDWVLVLILVTLIVLCGIVGYGVYPARPNGTWASLILGAICLIVLVVYFMMGMGTTMRRP